MVCSMMARYPGLEESKLPQAMILPHLRFNNWYEVIIMKCNFWLLPEILTPINSEKFHFHLSAFL